MTQAEKREQLQNNWPYESVVPEDDEPLDDVLTAIAARLYHAQSDIDYIQDQQLLQTATGGGLESLAAEVDVYRQAGESDASLRKRALINKAETQSKGSFADLEKVLQVVFDDITKIRITAVQDRPTTTIGIPQSQLDDIPLTINELEAELQGAIPVSDPLNVVTADTFIFGETGEQGLGGELV